MSTNVQKNVQNKCVLISWEQYTTKNGLKVGSSQNYVGIVHVLSYAQYAQI